MYAISSNYGVTEQAHRDCTRCLEQAHSAVIVAQSTGAQGAASTHVAADGESHSARVVRLHAVIDCGAQT